MLNNLHLLSFYVKRRADWFWFKPTERRQYVTLQQLWTLIGRRRRVPVLSDKNIKLRLPVTKAGHEGTGWIWPTFRHSGQHFAETAWIQGSILARVSGFRLTESNQLFCPASNGNVQHDPWVVITEELQLLIDRLVGIRLFLSVCDCRVLQMFHNIRKTLELCSRSSNFLARLGRLQSLESQSDGGPARSQSELSGA